MATQFIKRSKVNVKISRYKRNIPNILVDIFDSAQSGVSFNKVPFTDDVNRQSPFFIIGSGRSGNTLLRKQLIENANICIPPEIPGLGSTIRFFTQNRSLPWAAIVPRTLGKFKELADVDVTNKNGFVYNLDKELNLNYETIIEKLLALPHEEQSLSRVIDAIYSNYTENNVDEIEPLIGDKTPWNSFHLKRILKVYPNAKFIHIVRDSRAVVSSYIKSLAYLNNTDLNDSISRWLDSVTNCLKAKNLVKEGNFYQIKYEDLVTFPETEIKKLFIFLKVKHKNKINKVLEDNQLSHHSNLNKPITNEFIHKWKNELSGAEINSISHKTRKLMEQLNYDI
jgi:protein-tyrosine sulfotransferase